MENKINLEEIGKDNIILAVLTVPVAKLKDVTEEEGAIKSIKDVKLALNASLAGDTSEYWDLAMEIAKSFMSSLLQHDVGTLKDLEALKTATELSFRTAIKCAKILEENNKQPEQSEQSEPSEPSEDTKELSDLEKLIKTVESLKTLLEK